jgi:hypothetical protein
MLLPLLIWLICYTAAFGIGHFIELATSNSIQSGMPWPIIRGMLIWPVGVVDRDWVRLATAWQGNVDSTVFAQGALIALNVLLWSIIIAVLVELAPHALRLMLRSAGAHSEAVRRAMPIIPLLYAMIWLLSALVFSVMAGQAGMRHGSTVYPFLLIAGAVMFETPGSIINDRRTRIAQKFACAATIGAFAYQDFSWYSHLKPIPSPDVAALHDALASRFADVDVVYVFNAPDDIDQSPELLRQAWQLPFEVRFINSFVGCLRAQNGTLAMKSGELVVAVPDCASISLFGIRFGIFLDGLSGYVHRAGVGYYHFPEGRVARDATHNPEQRIIDFGKTIIVKLEEHDRPFVLLYYDWADGRYHQK